MSELANKRKKSTQVLGEATHWGTHANSQKIDRTQPGHIHIHKPEAQRKGQSKTPSSAQIIASVKDVNTSRYQSNKKKTITMKFFAKIVSTA